MSTLVRDQLRKLQAQSGPQAELCKQLEIAGHPFAAEYRFDPNRKWRIDLAFVAEMLAVEVEGGVWQMGRHQRPAGFLGDIEKYNALTLAGWRLIRVTPDMITSGEALVLIEQVLT